jgi:membrane-bound ClpP family serine protease
MSLLAVAVLLFVLALVIFAIDLMIPSGGILVGVTCCFAFAAVVVAFRYSTSAGLWMLITALGSAPVLMWVFVVVWPRTPLGRRMIAVPDVAGPYVWSDAAQSGGDGNTLVGQEGIALNEMIPSGNIQIGDKTYEAFSETGPIEQGKTVRVTRLDVGRLVVTIVRERSSKGTMSEGTGLDRPISELNLESLD